MFCVFCLRQLTATPGAMPLCTTCYGQFMDLPTAERMELGTKAAGVMAQQRTADRLHVLTNQISELIDNSQERKAKR